MERLRQNDAIVGSGRNTLGMTQIGDEGGGVIGGIDIDDIARGDRVPTEAVYVHRLPDFEHSPANVCPVPFKEALDVMSIDRCPAVPTPLPALRLNRQVSPIDASSTELFQPA